MFFYIFLEYICCRFLPIFLEYIRNIFFTSIESKKHIFIIIIIIIIYFTFFN